MYSILPLYSLYTYSVYFLRTPSVLPPNFLCTSFVLPPYFFSTSSLLPPFFLCVEDVLVAVASSRSIFTVMTRETNIILPSHLNPSSAERHRKRKCFGPSGHIQIPGVPLETKPVSHLPPHSSPHLSSMFGCRTVVFFCWVTAVVDESHDFCHLQLTMFSE